MKLKRSCTDLFKIKTGVKSYSGYFTSYYWHRHRFWGPRQLTATNWSPTNWPWTKWRRLAEKSDHKHILLFPEPSCPNLHLLAKSPWQNQWSNHCDKTIGLWSVCRCQVTWLINFVGTGGWRPFASDTEGGEIYLAPSVFGQVIPTCQQEIWISDWGRTRMWQRPPLFFCGLTWIWGPKSELKFNY